MTAEWIELQLRLNVQTEAIKSLARRRRDWARHTPEQRAAGSASRHQYGAQRTRQGLRNLRRKLKSHTTGMRELRTHRAHGRFRNRQRDAQWNELRRQSALIRKQFLCRKSCQRSLLGLLPSLRVQPVLFDAYATTKCHDRQHNPPLNL